jgi:nicotinamide-nucleotide amidase
VSEQDICEEFHPEPSAEAAVRALATAQQTLATAESLTGGLIGAWLTSVPGTSEVYRGGVITYATDLKGKLAGVREETLADGGPVAAETAAEMAQGAARLCGADWGLAVTGVAGPDPQDGHPVGQVFLAVAGPRQSLIVRELSLTGDRDAIRRQTAEQALYLLAEAFGMDTQSMDHSATPRQQQ